MYSDAGSPIKKFSDRALKPELIKQHIDSFPVLPATVTRLMAVTNDPESSAQDVVKTILPDQSLCLTILKIANSALYGRPQKADSLTAAVTVLGFNEVQNIALTKAIMNSFSKIKERHKPSVDKFWMHSFVCGMAARIIARDLRLNADTAYMAGLIHDIGKLIMLETFCEDYSAEHWMTAFSDEEMLQNEQNAFTFTHELVGGQLLRKWLFPENLITAVANHHLPSEAAEEKCIAHIVQLADILSFYCCNAESLGKDDILTALHSSLPDMRSQWKDLHMPIENDAIAAWFDWLSANYEQGSTLRQAIST